MALTLYPYQEEGVRMMEWWDGRALLGDQQGLGKTIQVLEYIRRHKEVRPIVVVCPAHLKLMWQREAARHCGMAAEVVGGLTPPPSTIPTRPQMVIVNYDVLAPSERKGAKGTRVRHPGWAGYLKKLRPQLVVADEAQYLQTLGAARTRSFRKLCRGVDKVILASGTPINNRLSGLFPLVNTLRPEVEDFASFTVFGHKYCGAKKEFGRWTFKGATRVEELRKVLLDTCLIRRLKKDVLDQLPPLTRTVLPVEIEDRHKYDEAFSDFTTWLRVYGKQEDRQAERLRHFTYIKGLVAKLKLGAVLAWVEDFLWDGEEKLLLFGIHRQFVHAAHERFPNSVCVTGEVTGHERQLRFDRFNKDKKCRLLVGNIEAAGTGWSCTAASTVAHGELAWKPSLHAQAEARLHGLCRGVVGVPSRSIWFVAHNTIEEKICRLLFSKQTNSDNVLDGGEASEGNFDLMTALERELLQERVYHA